jgi:hypothetical protein
MKSCPSCHKKVEKSKIMVVETAVGTKVNCCENCISYFKVRRKL